MTRNASHTVMTIGIAAAIGLSSASAAPEYAGTKSCSMCHKKADKGDQAGAWKKGPHSKTYTMLAGDEAKAVAKKLGIADPQKSPKCLSCHTTAYDGTEAVVTKKIKVEEGVSCESCHGAGKAYKKKSTMQSRDKSIAAGMVYPATKSCVKCHNDKSPTWKPDRYTDKDGKKVGFDADKAYAKIKHPDPTRKK